MPREELAKWQRNTRYRVLTRDLRICQYCLRKGKTVDHLLSIAKGGTWLENNMIACCFDCNTKKKFMSVLEFLVTYKDHFERLGQSHRSIMERITIAQNAPLGWGSVYPEVQQERQSIAESITAN